MAALDDVRYIKGVRHGRVWIGVLVRLTPATMISVKKKKPEGKKCDFCRFSVTSKTAIFVII